MDLARAYSETGPKIVGYLVATGTGEATALDLLHDAVVRVARRIGESRGADDDLPALLFATARNLRANFVRDGRRLAVVESPEELDGRTVDGLRATEAADAAYLRRRICGALGELSPELREAYTLYQVGGLSVREVAEATGASENLVKVRMHRAKAALRKSLGDIKGEA